MESLSQRRSLDWKHRRFGAGCQSHPANIERNIKLAVERKRRFDMDQTAIIRIVAGVLFVIVLVVLIQRRRTQVK
jgi:hypothetical protein